MSYKVIDLLSFLHPRIDQYCPTWPPDVHALTSSILKNSGAYVNVLLRGWPPKNRSCKQWDKYIEDLGYAWRDQWTFRNSLDTFDEGSPPKRVSVLWNVLWKNRSVSVSDVPNRRSLWEALVELNSISDVASAQHGIISNSEELEVKIDASAIHGFSLLQRESGASLSRIVDARKALVLPKFHTPQSGITLRSMTHHLGFVSPTEVKVRWLTKPLIGVEETHQQVFNFLLVPWPKTIRPRDFVATKPRIRYPQKFGEFAYTRKHDRKVGARLTKLVAAAENLVGKIDTVILPELSIRRDELSQIQHVARSENLALICGAFEDRRNFVSINIPGPKGLPMLRMSYEQHKHHRWKLDRNQIITYGLGAVLDPDMQWWESAEVKERSITFSNLTPTVTTCVLICEDLARIEPVGEIIRTVGPTLVIALLMDGPQLERRWASRYATVLSDDPGSAVLTFSSIGMVNLSRPIDCEASSRVIALWKDALTSKTQEIVMPSSAEAMVLTLRSKTVEEFTADGRSDNDASGHLSLVGVHPICLEK